MRNMRTFTAHRIGGQRNRSRGVIVDNKFER